MLTIPSTIRTVIACSDPETMSELRRGLGKYPDFEIVAEFLDVEEAARLIHGLRADVVFLDLDMASRSVADPLAVFESTAPTMVVMSYRHDYALRAFDANATDYLTKPIDKMRYEVTILRARREALTRFKARNSRPSEAGSETIVSAQRPLGPRNADIWVKAGSTVTKVPQSEIRWIAADRGYIHLHLNRRKIMLRSGLAEIEEKLDPYFFVRIHRSSIINMEHLDRVVARGPGQKIAHLDDGVELPVGRKYKNELDQRLRQALAV